MFHPSIKLLNSGWLFVPTSKPRCSPRYYFSSIFAVAQWLRNRRGKMPFEAQNAVSNLSIDCRYCLAHPTFSLSLATSYFHVLDHFEAKHFMMRWKLKCVNTRCLFAARVLPVGYHWFKRLCWSGDSVVKWRACPILLCCFGQLCRSNKRECDTSSCCTLYSVT